MMSGVSKTGNANDRTASLSPLTCRKQLSTMHVCRGPSLYRVLGIHLLLCMLLAGFLMYSASQVPFHNMSRLTFRVLDRVNRRTYSKPLPRILFHVIASNNHLSNFLQGHSREWLEEIGSMGDLAFSTGEGASSSLQDTMRTVIKAYPFVKWWTFPVDDSEYPPLIKTQQAFQHISSTIGNSYGFVVHIDSDTHISPARVRQLLVGLDPSERIYMGRPLHHCQCTPNIAADAPCTASMGVSYCSGMGYIISQQAMSDMNSSWVRCLDPQREEMTACRSSDSLVGLCFNEVLDLSCTAAVYADAALPEHGKSWGKPDAKGVKQRHDTLLCQDPSHQGGVNDRNAMGNPSNFIESDWSYCAAVHPVKSIENMRYARYAMVRGIEPPVLEVSQCKIAIGVLSVATDHLARDAIRSTWGRLAKALRGIRLYFVIGAPKTPLAPHEQLQLRREMDAYDDLVHVDMQDSYENLYTKSVLWIRWALEHTSCETIFKTDSDTYVRVLTMLQFLRFHFGNNNAPRLAYFGNQWGTWESQGKDWPRVIKDPKHRWYMYDTYPHDLFPPYMSGAGYGMTRDVAEWVSSQFDLHPRYRCEDAGVGILISKLHEERDVTYITGAQFQYNTCSSETIIDNPSYSFGFNMYEKFQDDLNGMFCSRVDRSSMVAPGSDPDAKEQMYALRQQSRNDGGQSIFQKRTDDEQTAVKTVEWQYWDGRTLYGGKEVSRRFDADELSLLDNEKQRAQKAATAELQCQATTIVSSWLSVRLSASESISLVQCAPSRQQAHEDKSKQFSMALVHVPFGNARQRAATLPIGNEELAILVPCTCNDARIISFLSSTGVVFATEATGSRVILLAHTTCDPQVDSVASLDAIAELTQFKETYPDVDLRFLEVGGKFSRSKNLNAGFKALPPTTIVAVMDLDMQVTGKYFAHCRAFARPGDSVYFPVVFSEYNPTIVREYKERMGWTEADIAKLTISADTGVWRNYGYGMLAITVSDALSVGLWNEQHKEWGMEDVDFHAAVQAARLVVWRMVDPTIVHRWHEKNCEHLRNTDRYTMCLRSKAGVEGNAVELAVHMDAVKSKHE